MAGTAGAKTLPQLSLRSGIGGAGWAGTQALGESEGTIPERVQQAGKPMRYGAGFASALKLATKGLGWVGNQTLGRAGCFQDIAAQRKVFEALQRDGLTFKQAQARIEKMGPESALMDVGPNSQALAYQAYVLPGRGKEQIRSFLTKRQEGH